MGRGKKNGTSLGKTLMKTGAKPVKKEIQSSAGKHVAVADGGDATAQLASYLEGSSLVRDRVATCTEKERIVVLESHGGPTLATAYVRLAIHSNEGAHGYGDRDLATLPSMDFAEMKVPRRPKWDATTTAAELNLHERESFLSWRRDIALYVTLEAAAEAREVTPFEKNLEVWRQLWRVIERSDIVVQIVDARNPLFYRSMDLERYVKEVDENKQVMLIVNKSDFLTPAQRVAWADYFKDQAVDFVFFSAKEAQELLDAEYKQANIALGSSSDDEEDEEDSEEEVEGGEVEEVVAVPNAPVAALEREDCKVLTREDLLEYMETRAKAVFAKVGLRSEDRGLVKFGMVGFPNVGKSSAINALLGASNFAHHAQRVAVGATPGKTKHFQTLALSDTIMLCDCPGLVFPSFVNSKAEMLCCGVLPIAQLRDHVPPCELVARRIPRVVFEKTYGIKVPVPNTGKYNDPVNVYSVLEVYARARGFTTTGKSGPDTSRAARVLLRDYVMGKLLYCHPPPTVDVADAAFNPLELAKDFIGGAAEVLLAHEDEEGKPTGFDLAGAESKRKGRKGRDKNPYEDMDNAANAVTAHVSRGKKIDRREKAFTRVTLPHHVTYNPTTAQ
ncbi:hypothetical protein DYB25_003002 [Aphanomyces astaci]|uniref:G domain-containing protein n=1 Tax=Aphanomyces astaci TaxID=112090 RepID=A0A397CD63_APHAT|nr:hypothetical protein DYB25_003002 [Aphanomyces astaci]RHY08877.1 hypothetical protein DYB36_003454 [Aphanomyces astaci]RHY41377.1 hypothetical protein DYB30_002686 [Aphanomyces astaci]RHY54616.1 hypothetical protein DYB38_002874 [Aphanomyces astaci]